MSIAALTECGNVTLTEQEVAGMQNRHRGLMGNVGQHACAAYVGADAVSVELGGGGVFIGVGHSGPQTAFFAYREEHITPPSHDAAPSAFIVVWEK